MAASLVNMDNGTEGIPDTEMPVWIMGKSYSAIYGKSKAGSVGQHAFLVLTVVGDAYVSIFQTRTSCATKCRVDCGFPTEKTLRTSDSRG